MTRTLVHTSTHRIVRPRYVFRKLCLAFFVGGFVFLGGFSAQPGGATSTFLGIPLPRTRPVLAGSPLTATVVSEAGSVFDPADGSGVRYLTALDSTRVVHEARSSLGVPLGDLRRTPDLSSAPPVIGPTGPGVTVTDPGDSLDLRNLDGVTPFVADLFHPTLIETRSGTLGLYAIDGLPTGMIHYFESTDEGATWTLQGFPILPGFGGGSGLLSVISVDNSVHIDGFEVRAFYQDGGGNIRALSSSIVSPGPLKYFTLDLTTDQLVLPAAEAGPGGFTPSGAVIRLASGGFGMFFVPQTDSYIGFAESDSGLSNWTVTRGAANPILSTAANLIAPDPARPEVKEVSVCPLPVGYRLYFTGRVPGGFPFDRAVGAAIVAPFIAEPFVRGDCNADGNVELSDAICSLAYLFSGGSVGCLDALDANDSGGIDISDPVAILEYLFSGGSAPPAPFPDCGPDATLDALDCLTPAAVCL